VLLDNTAAGAAANAAMTAPALAGGDLGAALLRDAAAAAGALAGRVGWGKYAEDRTIYTSEHFAAEDGGGGGGGGGAGGSARTIHLGVDLQLPAGTALRAPLAGVVHSWARNEPALDYGPAVVLRHDVAVAGAGAVTFYTLWGHLSLSTLLTPSGSWRLTPGARLRAGEVLGWVGGAHVNGGWPPHLHLQVNTELEHGGWAGDYPGVCAREDFGVYSALCPDPNVLLRCPAVPPHGAWQLRREASGDVAAVAVVGEAQ